MWGAPTHLILGDFGQFSSVGYALSVPVANRLCGGYRLDSWAVAAHRRGAVQLLCQRSFFTKTMSNSLIFNSF
eukprot:COSAG01_NODE_68248_length_264_cov_1.539394_1_plen_72_part_01